MAPTSGERAPGRSLTAFAAAVSVTHHVGALPVGWYGTVGPTRWTDWLDLLTPFLVLGTAAAVLRASGASPREWLTAGVAGVCYTQGHALHLAANSVSNRLSDDAVHLWDEVVGHLLWYAGLALLVVVLIRSLARCALCVPWWGWALAAALGLTHATNALEGGTAVPSLAFAVALCVWSRRLHGPLRHLLIVAYGLAGLLIACYGLAHGG